MGRNWSLRAVLALGTLLAVSVANAGFTTIFVDDDGDPAAGGTSWADATPFLSVALSQAGPGDTIRVAQGTYFPDREPNFPEGNGDRFATFAIGDGPVELLGGYAGINADDPDERDPNVYKTFLSGDIGELGGFGDNSYHVLTVDGALDGTVVEGFEITQGNANGNLDAINTNGAGALVQNADIEFRQCMFVANRAGDGSAAGGLSAGNGGAIAVFNSFDVRVIHCEFRENSAGDGIDARCADGVAESGTQGGDGGAIYATGSIVRVLRSVFYDNRAGDGGRGITDCTDCADGAPGGNGGAVAFVNNLAGLIQDSLIYKNAAGRGGFQSGGECGGGDGGTGGGVFSQSGTLTLRNVTVSENNAGSGGFSGGAIGATGGVWIDGGKGGNVLVISSIIFANTAALPDRAAQLELSGSVTASYNCVQNWDGAFPGEGNIADSPQFLSPVINNYRLSSTSPCIDTGDPLYMPDPDPLDLDGNPRVANGRVDMGAYELRFDDCNNNGIADAQEIAQGLVGDCNENGVPDDCDIADGTSDDCQADGIPDECQLAPTLSYRRDDGFAETSWSGGKTPSYGWFNAFTVSEGFETVDEIQVAWGAVGDGIPVIAGLWSDPSGDGNPIDAQLLVSVNAATVDGGSGEFVSIAIPPTSVGSVGDQFYVGVIVDVTGVPAALVDLSDGSGLSYGASGSFTTELINSAAPIGDIVGGGVWLLRAVARGDSNDLNDNGIPDDCEPDCNLNGIPDDLDIAECSQDLACADCNLNGIPDGCEIDDGSAEDCQMDGIPDDCQLGLLRLARDDGYAEDAYDSNLESGQTIIANGYRFFDGPEEIIGVEIGWPAAADGLNATVFIWSDGDDDLEPDFTSLVREEAIVVAGGGFQFVPLSDGYTPPDTSAFLVGVRFDNQVGDEPALIDRTNPQFASYVISSDGALAPEDFATAAPLNGENAGNWLIRAIYAGEDNDLNGNGVPDECDPDCNNNGIPDDIDLADCQFDPACGDCNNNGVPDSCDIADETSNDINNNGIPDECEPDCNGNMLPDDYDIGVCDGDPACGDCNLNGIPDGCEIDAGSVQDCNADGIPDECQIGLERIAVDDGYAELALPTAEGSGQTIIANSFSSDFFEPQVFGVEIAWPAGYDDRSATVYLWQDTDNDGQPDLTSVVREQTIVTAGGTFQYVPFDSPYTPPETSSFYFIGVRVDNAPDVAPLLLDRTSPQNASWLLLGEGNVEPGEFEFANPLPEGLEGNWQIRAITFSFNNDCNENGIPDDCEPDCDGDGVPDECEILNCIEDPECGDCNENGIPDGCEFALEDCNFNFILDGCEIDQGLASDCNANGVPDECDIESCDGDPECADCDGDGVPDGCDYALGDCDGNGVLDACEIAQGLAADCDQNGIPDSCDIFDCEGDPACGDCDENGTPDGCEFDDLTDCNGNGLSDACEIAYELAVDCNGNGIPDECDILFCDGDAACGDCNQNGVPDGCEYSVFDCNNNGLVDQCEIEFELAEDCDDNLIPDECDIAACEGDPFCGDCNGNGSPDGCDIAFELSDDVNQNGIPDECEADCNDNGVLDDLEILDGAPDCDGNGVPDDCQADSDSDGVIDACDGCPNDPNKLAPGDCGCGVADTDSDADGTPDCLDGCPNDASKLAPGDCGCGVAETDSDGDGVPDCVDNCPSTFNPDQADGDGNGEGDACDSLLAFSGCPTDGLEFQAADLDGVVVDYEVPATVNGIGTVSVSADPPSGALFEIGTTEVVITATDEAGGLAECVFVVTVLEPDDTELPQPGSRLWELYDQAFTIFGVPLSCGTGAMIMLPFTLLGLTGMKLRRRIKR